MRRPTIAGVMPSSRAAAERLPRCDTSMKVVSSLKRSISERKYKPRRADRRLPHYRLLMLERVARAHACPVHRPGMDRADINRDPRFRGLGTLTLELRLPRGAVVACDALGRFEAQPLEQPRIHCRLACGQAVARTRMIRELRGNRGGAARGGG